MSNNKKKEYFIFIDDSGNIEFTSSNGFFIYGALIFNSQKEIKKFRINFEKILIKCFGSNKEIKASSRIKWKNRKKIYDCIINSGCKLMVVIEDKNKSTRIKSIENDYNNNLKLISNLPLKAHLAMKQIRKTSYGQHKSYLIAQLICLIVQNVKKTQKMNINIIIDKDTLSTPGNSLNFTGYLNNEQKYLKLFNYNYSYDMIDSKTDYCLQGADFFANAIYRLYNNKDKQKFNYINKNKKIIFKEFPYIKKEFEKDIIFDKIIENDNI